MPPAAPAPLVPASAEGAVNGVSNDTGVLDALVAEKVEFSLMKGETSIGVISSGEPTWSWYVGSLGLSLIHI